MDGFDGDRMSTQFIDQFPAWFPECCAPSVGVELEFGLVDAVTGQPVAAFDAIQARLPEDLRSQVHPEALKCQIEFASRPQADMLTLTQELQRFYDCASQVAERQRVVMPWVANFPDWPFDPAMGTDRPRSRANAARLGDAVRYLATNSLHIHVAVPRSKAIEVLDAVRRFVPLFAALSANSPMELGQPTGYMSKRLEVWSTRFAMCGLPSAFGDWEGLQSCLRMLLCTGKLAHPKDLYFLVRPTRFGTLELRVCDLPANMNQVLALTALFRCLVVALQRGSLVLESLPCTVLRAELHDAYRQGLNARLLDHCGRVSSPLEWFERLHLELADVSRELDCEVLLSLGALALIENGALQQLRTARTGATKRDNLPPAVSGYVPWQRAGWLTVASGALGWLAGSVL